MTRVTVEVPIAEILVRPVVRVGQLGRVVRQAALHAVVKDFGLAWSRAYFAGGWPAAAAAAAAWKIPC